MSDFRIILMVDDEPAVHQGVRRMMRRTRPGWTIEYAGSVAAARTRLAAGGVDLVVTDFSMPGGSGLDLVAAIRSDAASASMPVILLTGANQVDLKRQALELGAADLLDKPVDPGDLVARIDNLLRERDRSRAMEDRSRELTEAVRARTAELEASQLEVIFRLAILAEYRDETTGNHVIRVGTYAQLIAGAMGLDERRQGELLLAAPLHDIGKVAIPDQILRKGGPLLDAEWEVMRSHCRIGHEILTGQGAMESTMRSAFSMLLGLRGVTVRNPILETAAEIALTHHERWDGGGYPQGLAGDGIPLTGRIVAVADVFDALTSERSYKAAMPIEDAVQLIQMERGRHFDPAVIDAFMAILPDARATHDRLGDASLRRRDVA
jgi:putative two-component system response regulator